MKRKEALSILQVLILILGIVSISYVIGSETTFVTALYNDLRSDEVSGATQGSSVGSGSSLTVPESEPLTPIPADPLPTTPSHGFAGQAYEGLEFGSTAPAGLYETAEGTIEVSGAGYSISGILQAAGHALMIYYGVQMVGGVFGFDDAQTEAASYAAAWGYFVGKSALSIWGEGGYFASGLTVGWATVIGLVVAAIIYIYMYEDIETKEVTFTCEPWSAQTGGNNCEKCNKQGDLPCSEYQCRSLGQACQLLNAGTENEKCAWVNPKDITPPAITTNKEDLLDGYEYSPDNTISPPDRGVKILNQNSKDACADAFTPFTFGITTDEPAKCKIDYLRKDSFEEMNFYFGGNSLLTYEHTQAMALPGGESLSSENITLENGGQFELYTRCEDANGNSNTANFVFKYCVEDGPDTTPPLIVGTSLINKMPVAYNQTSVDLEVYINEPAECKWSHLDQSYDDMENEMSCSSSIKEINAQGVYPCSVTLDGIKNNEENDFYFRCKDKPLATSDRNVNSQSYKFTMKGTIPLVIDSASPDNETIKDSTDAVQVTLKSKTSAGYNEGAASCFYSEGDEDNYVLFYETTFYEHSQDLWLPAGEYNYFIKCVDLGGNSDTKEINFIVESDNVAPLIVRAYHDEPYLKIITDEESECVFDTTDCSYLFDDGTIITTSNGFDHFTEWNTKTNLYIKCRDIYGNSPQPSNVCSIEVRAF